MPVLTVLSDLPAFAQVCAAAGGVGERVEDPAELSGAIDRALSAVTRDRPQALRNNFSRSQ